MTPPEYGVFTNIGQNFAETLPKIFFTLYIFSKKLVSNAFLMNVAKKNYFAEKVIVCSKGLKGVPSNTLKLFPQNIFLKKFSIIIIFFYLPIQDLFPKNMHLIKRKTFLTTRSSN